MAIEDFGAAAPAPYVHTDANGDELEIGDTVTFPPMMVVGFRGEEVHLKNVGAYLPGLFVAPVQVTKVDPFKIDPVDPPKAA